MIYNVIDGLLGQIEKKKIFDPNKEFYVLDLGCKSGEICTKIKSFSLAKERIAVDFDQDFLDKFKSESDRWIIFNEDIKNFESVLQGCKKLVPSFDITKTIVTLCDVIEHIPKEQGEKLLHDIAFYNPAMTILSTPSGYFRQDPENYPDVVDHKGQEHLCGWREKEFYSLKYNTFLIGKRIGDDGYFKTYPYAIVDSIIAFRFGIKKEKQLIESIIKDLLHNIVLLDLEESYVKNIDKLCLTIDDDGKIIFNAGKVKDRMALLGTLSVIQQHLMRKDTIKIEGEFDNEKKGDTNGK